MKKFLNRLSKSKSGEDVFQGDEKPIECELDEDSTREDCSQEKHPDTFSWHKTPVPKPRAPPPPISPPPPPPPPLKSNSLNARSKEALDLDNQNPNDLDLDFANVDELNTSSVRENKFSNFSEEESCSSSDDYGEEELENLNFDEPQNVMVTKPDMSDVKSPLSKKGSDSESSDDSSSYGSSVGEVEDFLDTGSAELDSNTKDGLPSKEQMVKPEEYVKSNFSILCNVPFFAQFTDDHQRQLFAQLEVQMFQDGDLIVEQGTIGDRMYVIIEGEVAVWKQLADGSTEDITHIYTRDFFGELALLYGKKRVANVSAVGKTTVMYLTKDSFDQFEEIRMFLFVSKVPLLKKLDKDTQLKVVRVLEPVTFEPGVDIVRQGDIGDAFYMITKGAAEVIENGERTVRLYDGHTFGQMALLANKPRLATVRTTEPLTALRLNAANFKKLLKDSGNAKLSSLITQDARNIRRRRSKREQKRRNSQHQQYRQRSSLRRHSIHSSYRFSPIISPAYTNFKPTLAPAKSFYIKGQNNTRTQAKKGSNQSIALKQQYGSNGSVVDERKKFKKEMKHGKKVINGFILLNQIGSGTFGVVRKCKQEKTGEILAIKIIDRSRFKKGKELKSKYMPSMDDMRKEVAIMKKLSHPNVVNLVTVIDDPGHDNLYLVTEYCSKGAIMSDISCEQEPYTEATARKYFRDVLLGLEYLHYQNVVHRDIKPMNLLITATDVVKIADFGAARMLMGDHKWIAGVAGTPAFMAPELLVEDSNIYDGPKVDLWSCGATLFMMVTGSPPWMSDDELQLARKVKNDELVFPSDWDRKGYSPHLKNLIRELLVKDPNKRLSLMDTMTHDWVTEEDTDTLPITYANLQRALSSENVRQNLTTEDHAAAIEAVNKYLKKDSNLTSASSQYSSLASPLSRRGAGSSFNMSFTSSAAYPSATTLNRANRSNQAIASGNRVRASTFNFDLGDDISYVEHQNIDSDDDMSQSDGSTQITADDIGRIDSFHKDSDDMLRVRVRRRNSTIHTMNTPLPPTAEAIDEVESSDEESVDLITLPVKTSEQDLAHTLITSHGTDILVSNSADLTKDEDFAPLEGSLGADVDTTATKGELVDWCGIRYGIATEQGRKATQEDKTAIVKNLLDFCDSPIQPINVFYSALFDGHGGDIVSEYLALNLHESIAASKFFPFQLKEASVSACISADRKFIHQAASSIVEHNRKVNAGEVRQSLLRTKADKKGTKSTIEQYRKAGSTAIVALISINDNVQQAETINQPFVFLSGDDTKAKGALSDINQSGGRDELKRTLYIAWVGDSRAVLCRGGIAAQLSIDHKARRKDEMARIRACGGTVDRNGRLNGVLAVSRAFGGKFLKSMSTS